MTELEELRSKLEAIYSLIPAQNPELIEAGYSIPASDILEILHDTQP